jgi:hypothetical protein
MWRRAWWRTSADYGFDAAKHARRMRRGWWRTFCSSASRRAAGPPLCWDNVVYSEPGLGFVVSTHQDIRVRPPEKTVFSAYVALSDRKASRRAAGCGGQAGRTAGAGQRRPERVWRAVCILRRARRHHLRGHAMAVPWPHFRSNAGMKALREVDGPILFAHADLSGFSVFEEAAWWGYRAASWPPSDMLADDTQCPPALPRPAPPQTA